MTRYHTYTAGDRQGRLVLVESVGREREKIRWMAQCDCGAVVKIIASHFRNGRVKSCGCYRAENNRTMNVTHGKSRTPEYNVWNGMRQRCENPNTEHFEYYGGRGISVCPRWFFFENFIADMGERPNASYTLERVDTNGNYEPSNCIWLPQILQSHNTRQNVRVSLLGKEMVMAEALRLLNIGEIRIYYRLRKYNETPQQAVDHWAHRLGFIA